MRTRLMVLAAALSLLASATSCDRFSVDASSSGPTSNSIEDAQKTGKTLKRFKDAYSAWEDAVENISADDELAVGQAASVELIKEANGLDNDDADLLRYVNSVGNLVAMQGARDPLAADKKPRVAARRFFFGVLKDDHLNAFSAPGGYVFITSGLLQHLSSECELAFVLGHEIAHVDAEDGLLALKGKTGMPAALGSLTKDAYGQVSDLFDNKQIFDGAADKLVEIGLHKLKFFSREQETAADARGLRYMMKAGYDPRGALAVLEILDAEHAEQPDVDDQTHDTPAKRMVAIRQLVDANAAGTTGFERWQRAVLAADPQ